MVDNPDTIPQEETRDVEYTETDPEQLLMRLLEDVIVYKDADRLVFTQYDLAVGDTRDTHRLTGEMVGGLFDPETQALGTNPKAVSWHHYQVEQRNGEWRCHVIVDV
jgi:SHS2 domain-containing protein